jgi:pimeloyl-ACP methyl ester carboxylesterase
LETTSTTFVLVHGAWRGSWAWKRVAASLRALGHTVYTPTLTGLGERSHLLSGDITLSTHITDIVNLLRWEELTDVVLCGHSYAGMVLTGLAGQVPERIRSLVFVDAYLPEEGQNMMSMVPEPFRQAFVGSASPFRGLYMPPIPAEVVGVNLRDRAWVDAQCTPHPLASFLENVAGRTAVEQMARRSYIYASGWGTTPFTAIYESLKARPGWTLHEAPCGHDVMIDMPELMVKVLLESA